MPTARMLAQIEAECLTQTYARKSHLPPSCGPILWNSLCRMVVEATSCRFAIILADFLAFSDIARVGFVCVIVEAALKS